MSNETILVLGDLVIPIGAGRGISQTLQPIDNGDLRRTVNGELIDLTRVENRKFESQVSTIDQASPTLAGIWKGSQLIVEFIENLRQSELVPTTSFTLIRDPVVSSIVGRDVNGDKVAVNTVVDRDITFVSAVKYVEFRPILTMLVVAMSFNIDEYAAEEGWTIDLEEV